MLALQNGSINLFMVHKINTPTHFYSSCEEVSELNLKYQLSKKLCEELPTLFCPSPYPEKDEGNCASVGYSTKIGSDWYAKPSTSDKEAVYSFVHGSDFSSYVWRFTTCNDCFE